MKDLLIDTLAATRLTRLVIEDTLPPVKRLRDRIVAAHSETVPVTHQREEGEPVQVGTTEHLDSWAELITCAWCAGMWCSLGVVLARRFLPRRFWQPLAEALAASMVVGLIESKVDVE